jgi:hypothetical protein
VQRHENFCVKNFARQTFLHCNLMRDLI